MHIGLNTDQTSQGYSICFALYSHNSAINLRAIKSLLEVDLFYLNLSINYSFNPFHAVYHYSSVWHFGKYLQNGGNVEKYL